jgi:putative methyltransferase (TIGR04325 family)
MDLKSIARDATPPAVWRAARRLVGWHARPEWEHVPEGWDAAARRCGAGWSAPGVVTAQREWWARWRRALEGGRPPAWSHEAPWGDDVGAQNTHLVFAYALLLAARGRAAVRMLDFGSGAGHYALLARALAPDVAVEYHGVDVAPLVALGRELLPDATFHVDDGWTGLSFDLVLASGSLNQVRDWRGALARLATATRGWLLVSRQPTTAARSFVFVQRPARYATAYPGWCLAPDELLEEASAHGLALARELLIAEAPEIAGAPGGCRMRAYLFRRR